MEYYEPSILKKIGNTIGPLLKIDSHTVDGRRGKFARLCIQFDITKSLPTCISIGKMKQDILYEGIGTLSFSCGIIGHIVRDCPSKPKADDDGKSRGAENEKEKSSLKDGEEKDYHQQCVK